MRRGASTAGEVLAALRGLDEGVAGELDEVPVVTEDGKLAGMAPLARLVRVSPDAPVTAACRVETPSVQPSARFREVLGWFEKYHLRALAVVDEFDELLGVINVEDVITRLARKR